MTTNIKLKTINNQSLVGEGNIEIAKGESTEIFYQNTESSVWTIVHNKGYRPVVNTFTMGGIELIGNIVHVSENILQVYFNTSASGYVILR